MKADEIRTRLEGFRESMAKLQAEMKTGDVESAVAAAGGSLIASSLFVAEIALQLAELNEKLTPASMVAAIREIQQTIDQLDPA